MQRKLAVALSSVGALCVALAVACVGVLFGPNAAYADDGVPEVTRGQWVHELVETFDVSVEDENWPEEYFTDIAPDSPYYHDFLLALEFGIIDEPAGGELRPNDGATRDFAAHTLNFCLGYEKQTSTYTFIDSLLCEHPDDDQVAVARGWFSLDSGKFQPEQAITATERAKALVDAKTVKASAEIDETHENEVEFAESAKVIPEGTTVTQTSSGAVWVTDCPIEIVQGDTFVAYFRGLPNAYVAESVTQMGNVAMIGTSQADAEDAYASIDYEGVEQLDLSGFSAGSSSGTMSAMSLRAQSSSFPSFTVTPGADGRSITAKASVGAKGQYVKGSIDVTAGLSNLDLQYDVKRDSAVIAVTGDMTLATSVNGSFSATAPIGSVNIAGVGSVKLDLTMNVDGEAYAATGGSFKAGLQVDKNGSVRALKSFTKKSPTLRAKVKMTQDLKLSANLNLLAVQGSIYAKAGTLTTAEIQNYTDKAPYVCASLNSCITASVGANASVNLIVWKKEWSATHTIWDMSNSPVKMQFHYEDGDLVGKCTRDEGAAHYTTKGSSNTADRYGGGGALTSLSDKVTYSTNYTVKSSPLSLKHDTTILGNLLVENNVYLNSYKLTVLGNLVQSSQNIDVGSGELDVAGDYRVQSRWTNSAGEPAYGDMRGYLYMRDPAATVRVGATSTSRRTRLTTPITATASSRRGPSTWAGTSPTCRGRSAPARRRRARTGSCSRSRRAPASGRPEARSSAASRLPTRRALPGTGA